MADGMWITLISLLSTLFFVLGVPIFLVIGYWIVGASWILGLTLDNMGATLSDVFTDGFALLAMPLFILTGDLINKSGIAKRLSGFAYSVLGFMRGGLAMASLGACGLFAAISGSNSATTATIGGIMYPEMKKGGYDERFAAATAAAGGTVGIIIPPSIIFIVYGFMMNLPISDLFVGGIIPGILMVCGMQLVCWFVCKLNGWGHLITWNFSRIMKTAFGAWLGFFAIGLVLWGIYTGKFSPTEAAGVTVGFCLIVGLVSYGVSKFIGFREEEDREDFQDRSLGGMLVVKGFRWDEVPSIVMRSAQITGILAPLIAISVVMQQILSLLGARDVIESFVTGMGGYYAVLFTAMAIVLLAGTVLESLPNTIILAPILAPIAHNMGVDPIHFAVVFLIGDAIGFITPPYGLNLYVASGVTGIPYFRLLKYTVPYLLSLLLVWFVVALWPDLSLVLLPNR
jgi:TRAP-type C4-dicarboxylate transport system permease large subunit